MSRNCHKSVYHGVILQHAQVDYIYPQILNELGIQGGIFPQDVERMLEKYPDTQAVLIVSPTYDGIVSDVEKIAEIVHKKRIPLIVDEAHGAHFPFGNGVFPKSALDCGADLVVQSLHKTLPSFTQTAVMHGRAGLVDFSRVERYLQIFQSSSPSYVFMAGIEQCIYEMEQHGTGHMRAFGERIGALREHLQRMKHLRLLGPDTAGKAGVFDVDQSKLVISCRDCVVKCEEAIDDGDGKRLDVGCRQMTGEVLSSWLRERYHLEMVMCGADYVVGIATYLDRQRDLDRLEEALFEIDRWLESDERNRRNAGDMEEEEAGSGQIWKQGLPAQIRMKPSEAVEQSFEECPIDACAGRISAEFIYLYPPGIPIAAPGELVTEEIVKQVLSYKQMGLPVQGMADPAADRLRVIAEG